MKITSLAVFCASKFGKNPLYEIHANAIGDGLAAKGLTLVYGGGGVGLMGTVADACLKKGGRVIGIIPEVLLQWEQYHKGLSELLVVPDLDGGGTEMASISPPPSLDHQLCFLQGGC